jgi:hypothetical protein
MLLAELVVVVLGILIAFQVEEWRQFKLERDEESRVLNAILDDLTLGDEELALWQGRIERNDEAMGPLMEKLSRGEVAEEAIINEFLDNAFGNRYWRPTSPGFAGARDAGKLTLIRDPDLVRRLVVYFDIAEGFYLDWRIDLDTRQRNVQEMMLGEHRASSGADADSLAVLQSTTGTVNDLSVRLAVPASAFPGSASVRNELLAYWRHNRVTLVIIKRARESVAKLQGLINAHLAEMNGTLDPTASSDASDGN